MHGCINIYFPESLPLIIASNLLIQIISVVFMKEFGHSVDNRFRGSAAPTSHHGLKGKKQSTTVDI